MSLSLTSSTFKSRERFGANLRYKSEIRAKYTKFNKIKIGATQ